MNTKTLYAALLTLILVLSFQAVAATPVNPDASPEARALLDYLHSQYGKKILSGQMYVPWGVDEIKTVERITGKLPAVCGFDYIHERDNKSQNKQAIEWAGAGGIVTMMWHWGAPTQGEGYRQSKRKIDIERCFQAGTAEHAAMWNDLARIADHLTELRDANVPVLWRPMHEFEGGWFWYGKGKPDQFIRLWKTMYDYFVNKRKLNNLIWVLCHSDQINGDWDPGKDYYDLAGPDTYTDGIQLKLYNKAKAIHGATVPIPYHECGTVPDPDECFAQDMPWSWWMLWHTHHLTRHDPAALKHIYNHDLIITRDELPNLKADSKGQRPATPNPNILLIMLDDMGYGDPGCYNPESKIPTPNIDRIAREGMRFTDAHAAGALCIPSRYGLLTGRYPSRAAADNFAIKAGTQTVASFLKSHSYKTAMVGKWHNGFDDTNQWKGKLKGGPYGCGFDYFFGIGHSLDIAPYFYIENDRVVQSPTETIAEGVEVTADIYDNTGWTPIQGAFWRSGKIAPNFKHAEVLGKFTDKAISVLKDHGQSQSDDPLFLYLAYAGPHTPWLPSDEFKGKSGAGLYGDFLMEIDHHVGKVIDTLDQSGLKDNTLIILTSDNGPVWYAENVRNFQHSSVGPLRGMKADAFEGGHRMPFIAAWPGRITEGTVCDQTICLTDIFQTLASVIAQPLPEGLAIDSVDILPLMLDEHHGPVRDITVHHSRFLAIRKGKYKYLDGKDSGGFSKIKVPADAPPGQLYDLDKDLAETENLYDKHPDMVETFKSLLPDYQK